VHREVVGVSLSFVSGFRLPLRRRHVELEGYLHPDFAAVAKVLRRQIATHAGGGAVCIYQGGECVVDLWGGERNASGSRWHHDTMAPSFSTTKGVASTLLHMMVDRGLVDYDERVASYWPEFAQAGKDEITIRQVMAHQSGLYHIRQMIDSAERMLDWDYMVRTIERTPPIHTPGERTGYHGLTYGYIIGEILQRVTGTPFSSLVQAELAGPLGLDGMYVGATDDALARAASLLWPQSSLLAPGLPSGSRAMQRIFTDTAGAAGGVFQNLVNGLGFQLDFDSIRDALAPRGISSFKFDAHDTLRASIPAANGLFTARSLARMYAGLAGGGEIDGVRLMSRATLERATEVQRPPASRAVIPFDMKWRLGYHGIMTSRGSPRNAFGHFGFGGSGGWADPSRRLAVGLIVNSGMGTPFGDLRIVRISGAALGCADRRRRSV
jgi:CubicO group peptidase (beta-lactamase class C family)